MNAYWDIQATPNFGLNYDMKLYYKPEVFGTVSSEATLTVAKKDGVFFPWVSFLFGATTIDSSAKTMALGAQGSFALFTGTDAGNPLPVKLIAVSAHKINDAVLINWSTAAERNSSAFDVERSYDGISFGYIGRVKASGYSDVLTSYNFKDHMPGGQKATQTLYYRLKMISKDGSYEYSKTVGVQNAGGEPAGQLTLYPNPFKEDLYINILSAGDGVIKIEVTDMAGKKVLDKSAQVLAGSNTITVDDRLDAGVYFLSVEINGDRQVRKIIKE
jgi:hypothetical protein